MEKFLYALLKNKLSECLRFKDVFLRNFCMII